MSELVERVAKAIAKDQQWPDWTNATLVARAAIEAMREPTKEMIDAVYKRDPYDEGVGPENTWKYMIDAALVEEP